MEKPEHNIDEKTRLSALEWKRLTDATDAEVSAFVEGYKEGHRLRETEVEILNYHIRDIKITQGTYVHEISELSNYILKYKKLLKELVTNVMKPFNEEITNMVWEQFKKQNNL